jgi:hypothetical protein
VIFVGGSQDSSQEDKARAYGDAGVFCHGSLSLSQLLKGREKRSEDLFKHCSSVSIDRQQHRQTHLVLHANQYGRSHQRSFQQNRSLPQ